MLSIPEGDQIKSFYLMIDRLDERWVDDSIRFKLIKALIETLKPFRKIHNLKILVALRLDVFERVVQETDDLSFQREKYEDNMIRLIWTKKELRSLVESRIELLFKRKYTSNAVQFEDVFPPRIGNKDTFDWIIDRTLMRPRDLIAFVNEALDAAAGQSVISNTALRKAESEFARKRKDALIQEWRSVHPSLGKLLNIFARKKKPIVPVSELMEASEADELALDICSDQALSQDPVSLECQTYINSKHRDPLILVQEAVLLCIGRER